MREVRGERGGGTYHDLVGVEDMGDGEGDGGWWMSEVGGGMPRRSRVEDNREALGKCSLSSCESE